MSPSLKKILITILLLLASIAFPSLVVILSYYLNIDGYNIAGAIALFGVFLSSYGVYYSNEKSNERIEKQIISQEENLKKQLIFNKKQEILTELLFGMKNFHNYKTKRENDEDKQAYYSNLRYELDQCYLFLNEFKDDLKNIYLDDELNNSINDFLEIYNHYSPHILIFLKSDTNRYKIKISEKDFKKLQEIATVIYEKTKEKLSTGDF